MWLLVWELHDGNLKGKNVEIIDFIPKMDLIISPYNR